MENIILEGAYTEKKIQQVKGQQIEEKILLFCLFCGGGGWRNGEAR